MDVITEFRRKFARKAIVLEIGGFRPSETLSASWFGRVNLGSVGEQWPLQDGKPMHALAQINLTEFPFRTSGLEDIDFITVFIGPEKIPLLEEPNGTHWVLRAYKNIANLAPLEEPGTHSSINPFQMRPKVIEDDFPCFDDVSLDLRKQLWEAYQENRFENAGGFKLGGWPTLIQSEIYWAPLNQHPYSPRYVFQIDTTEKGNWMWGDNGVGHFGRGTSEGHWDNWVLEWQCF